MPDYNKIYSSVSATEAAGPSLALRLIWKNLPRGGRILDLGCGLGNDSLFLVENGFKVTAVDSSSVAIERIRFGRSVSALDNLEAACGDIRDFPIEKDRYQAILCRNVLNFLDKGEALKILGNLKEKLPAGGYVVVEAFTEDDPSFVSENRFSSYFDRQELLAIFSGYDVIYYLENIILDPGHPGSPEPHKHGVAKIITRKKPRS